MNLNFSLLKGLEPLHFDSSLPFVVQDLNDAITIIITIELASMHFSSPDSSLVFLPDTIVAYPPK